MPWPESSKRRSQSWRRATGSMPAVGSSRKRSVGSWSMAQPRARRCFQPPESCAAVELDNFIDAALQARGLQAVDAAVELQVFRDGQVVVETEILRHVADVLADRFGIGADVEAFHEGGTAAEWQKAGEHLDDGGFSAAVGAEEAEDFAFFDAEADVVDGGEVAETAHEMFGGDGGLGKRLLVGRHSVSFGLSVSHPQPCRRGPDRRDP